MGIFSRKPRDGGLMDVIRCDEPSYLVWKWHPEGTIQGKSKRENSIRLGSALRVKEGSVAVFFYNQECGTEQEFIYGPYDGLIATNNFPVLANIIDLAYGGNAPFQAEVYFINLAEIIQIKVGIPYFDVFDFKFSECSVPVAVRGTLSFMIRDPEEFIRLHRLDNFSLDDFRNQIKDSMIKHVKNIVLNAPEDYGISVLKIEKKILEINDSVMEQVKPNLESEFGILVSGLDIAAIDIDKESEDYKILRKKENGATD